MLNFFLANCLWLLFLELSLLPGLGWRHTLHTRQVMLQPGRGRAVLSVMSGFWTGVVTWFATGSCLLWNVHEDQYEHLAADEPGWGKSKVKRPCPQAGAEMTAARSCLSQSPQALKSVALGFLWCRTDSWWSSRTQSLCQWSNSVTQYRAGDV